MNLFVACELIEVESLPPLSLRNFVALLELRDNSLPPTLHNKMELLRERTEPS